MSTAEMSMKTPTMNIGTSYPPVQSCTAPVRNGALNPAMLPIVLMRATPAAAAAPVRNCVGRVQKLGSAAKIAIAVIEMTAMVERRRAGEERQGDAHGAQRSRAGDVPGAEAARLASRDHSHSAIAAGM